LVTFRKVLVWSLLAFLLLALVMGMALGVGAVSIGWVRALRGVFYEALGWVSILDPTERAILLEIRLPRILLTGLVGMSLAVSGVVFQALLRNPLAEPFILGLSGGAALGALLSITLGLSIWAWVRPLAAFFGALLTVFMVFAVAGTRGRLNTTTVLLTGIIINAFFTSIIMLILTLSKEQKVQQMLFWLYGDLTSARFREVLMLLPLAVLALGFIFLYARGLNLLVTGEETALQLGVPVEQYKWVLFGVTSLLVGAVVSVSGIIGFVGLIVPHLVRMAVGPDHRVLLPLSALWGGIFLLLADTVARMVLAPSEVPVGVVTAALGAPFFILLLRHRGSQWSRS
jgi:iron complex transport system permease protein